MKLLAAIISLLLLQAMLVPVLWAQSHHDVHSGAIPLVSQASEPQKYYVKYTEFLNSSKIENGNVNYYSDIPGPAALLYDNLTGNFFAASGISSIYSVNMTGFHTGVNSSQGKFISSFTFGSSKETLYYLPGNNNLSEWNLSTGVLKNLTVGAYPQWVTYDPALSTLFVTVQGPDSLVAVNLTGNNVSYSLPLRFGPFGVAFDPYSGFLYISYPTAGLVSVFNPSDRSFVANITIGGSPYEFAVSNSINTVYLTNQGLNQVDVIDGKTNTVTSRINTGYSPSGIALAGSSGMLFVTNTDSSNVTIINTQNDTLSQTLQLGSQPYAVAYDSHSGALVVGNHGSDSLSFIYPVVHNDVVFSEKGLPYGTLWKVTVNGATRYTNTGTVSFDLGGGSVNYTASSIGGYYGQISGSLEIKGSSVVTISYHSVAFLHDEILDVGATVAIAGSLAGIWLFRGRRKR